MNATKHEEFMIRRFPLNPEIIDVRAHPELPRKLLEALARRRHGSYTDLKMVFYYVWLGWLSSDHFVGVAGDGSNASYEWFVWSKGDLRLSDVGFGDSAIALMAVLEEEGKRR